MYVEGIAGPQLEYSICSSAARLAQAQGLHKNVQSIVDVDPAARDDQRRIFWLVYCLDKNISLRNGRPSVRINVFNSIAEYYR